jgi:hypothetical protein
MTKGDVQYEIKELLEKLFQRSDTPDYYWFLTETLHKASMEKDISTDQDFLEWLEAHK